MLPCTARVLPCTCRSRTDGRGAGVTTGRPRAERRGDAG
ncbi:hypothetical protein GTW43_06920 [Streptomyces sp. SID5785]|nr:hypothetical protein [Streptomyces sp. SID5785]